MGKDYAISSQRAGGNVTNICDVALGWQLCHHVENEDSEEEQGEDDDDDDKDASENGSAACKMAPCSIQMR